MTATGPAQIHFSFPPSLCLPSNATDSQGHFQGKEWGKMILRPVQVVHQGTLILTLSQVPDIPEAWASVAPEPSVATPHSLVPKWLNPEEANCSEAVQKVHKGTYLSIWKHFFVWALRHRMFPTLSITQKILGYLLPLWVRFDSQL